MPDSEAFHANKFILAVGDDLYGEFLIHNRTGKL
jgi:hypothetical protein